MDGMDERSWPRNARALSARITRCKQQLRELGLSVDKLKSDRSWCFSVESDEFLGRVIEFRKRPQEHQHNGYPF